MPGEELFSMLQTTTADDLAVGISWETEGK